MVFGPAQVGFVFPKIKTKYLKRRDFRVFSFFLTSRTDALFSPASSFRGCDFEKGAPHSNSSRYLPTVFRRRSEFDSDPGSAPIGFRRRSGFSETSSVRPWYARPLRSTPSNLSSPIYYVCLQISTSHNLSHPNQFASSHESFSLQVCSYDIFYGIGFTRVRRGTLSHNILAKTCDRPCSAYLVLALRAPASSSDPPKADWYSHL